MTIGKPLFFDCDKYLDAVEMVINADEVERAFWMLDNLPGYYRDNPPKRAIEMRRQLHKNLFTVVQYKAHHVNPSDVDPAEVLRLWPGRGHVIENIVRALNDKGETPNIMELAPGTFWLPIGLKEKALAFTYEHLSVDDLDVAIDKPNAPSVNIFCAFEIIEHLSNEFEIYQNYLKFGREARYVALSTPLYTINGGQGEWHSRELGHLRTYTPREFLNKANAMFLNYNWSVYTDETIILIGEAKDG